VELAVFNARLDNHDTCVLSFIEHYGYDIKALGVKCELDNTMDGLLNLLGRLSLTRLTIEHGLNRKW
jgi:hypothetical protein